MIIYGIGNKLLKEAPVENLGCTNCEHQSSVVSVYQRYFDLFWVPTFPVGKSIVLVCPSCGNVTKEKDFPESFRQSSKQLKSSVSTPKYMFSGLVIILAFVSYIAFGSYTDGKLEEGYLDNPETGDVYAMYDEEEPTEYKYYFLKITDVVGDSIVFVGNEYGYDGITSEIFPEDGFHTFEFAYHKTDIAEMYDEGELVSIYRDYDETSGFHQTINSDSLILETYQHYLDSIENAEAIE